MPHGTALYAFFRARRHDLLALTLVVLLALVPRVVVLGADPPARVLGAFLSDEGWWAQNARQHLLFGKWVMSEHNAALFAAPAYTAALRLNYQIAGTGLAQTRLLSALAGAFACAVFFLGLRAVMPVRLALPPALLLALGSFAILLSRLALTEMLQLAFAIVALAGVLWATRYPPFGILGGLGLVGAVLTKPNAVILGPVFVAAWLLDYRDRRRAQQPLRPLVLQVAAFATAVVGSALAVVVLFLWPHWNDVAEQLTVSLANVSTGGHRLADGGAPVLLLPFLSLRPSLMFLESPLPVLGVVLLGWRRLAGSRGKPLDSAERLAWVWWWGVMGYASLQAYQPDRRFLLLVPALALLGARGLFERDFAPAEAAATPQWRGALAGAAGGALIGLFLMAYLIPGLIQLSAMLGIGGDDGISAYPLQILVWHGAVFAGALAGAWLVRRAPVWRWTVPTAVWGMLFVLTEPVSVIRDLLHPSYSERDAARAIARVANTLPPEQRVMTGFLANSLAFESDIFPFYIRDEPEIGAFINLDGWERFHPAMAVTATRKGGPVGLPLDPANHGLVPLCLIPLWHEVRDATPIEVTLWFAANQQPAPSCSPPARAVR